MANYIALSLSEHYSSQDPDLFDKMGPMRFPILDTALEIGYGTYWTVSRMRYPTNADQLASIKALISGQPFEEFTDPDGVVFHRPVDGAPLNNIVIANANKLRVTIVRGDFKLDDMGLHVYQDATKDSQGNITILPGKESKRIKAFTRPRAASGAANSRPLPGPALRWPLLRWAYPLGPARERRSLRSFAWSVPSL